MKNLSFRVGIAFIALTIVSLGVWHCLKRAADPWRIGRVDIPALQGARTNRGVEPRLNKAADLLQKAAEAHREVLGGLRQPEAARQQIASALREKFAGLAALRDALPRLPLRGKARGYGREVLDQDQQEVLDKLFARLGDGAQLQVDQVDGTVRFLRGDLMKALGDSPSFLLAREQGDYTQMAVATLTALSEALNIRDPSAEFTAQTPQHDQLNMVHVKLDQSYHGLPIWGAQLIVHFDNAGDPVQIQGVYAPTPSRLAEPNETISEQAAIAAAQRVVGAAGPGYRPPRVTKQYYWEPNVSPVLAYQVDLVPSLTESWHVFVSATDGSTLRLISDICSAAVKGQSQDIQGETLPVEAWQDGSSFLAIDTTLPMYDAARSQPPNFTNMFGAVAVFDLHNQQEEYTDALKAGVPYALSSDANQWDPTVVSVMDHFARVYNYYKTTHNRNSFDDKGISIVGLIHCLFKDANGNLSKDNAFFNGSLQMMIFGDGEKLFGPGKLPSALDATGHELTHGVVLSTANLAYENQSGALNEHIADYFGSMVARSNWWIAVDACVGTPKKMLRDMTDPHNPEAIANQPKTMAEYVNAPNTPQGDNGGVHINSGILNYASYLFTGGPQGIGREKGERIAYRALTTYLTQYSQFADYRRALLSAAQDLYPDGGATNAIVQAFNAVGILEGGATPPPTPVPPTIGDEQVLLLQAENDKSTNVIGYRLFLLAGQNLTPVTSRLDARARPAVSGDGQWGLYVGTDNNVYWTDGIQEQAWTHSGNVRSIAMTPDQHYIAFTTTDYDNTIALLDTSAKTSTPATLTVPTTGAGNSTDLSFADVLSFNCTGDTLIFDAFTQATVNKSVSGSWGLYGMRVKDLVCFALLPPSPGLDIGDPSMAHTLPYTLLANYVFTTNAQSTIGMVSLDLVNNRLGVLTNGLAIFPNPSFRGGDQQIVFASQDRSGLYYLNQATLTADRTALVSGSISNLIWSQNSLSYPVAFRSGTYTPSAGILLISPGSLDFGSVPIGQTATNSLTLTNSGNADLELISATFEGAATNAFGLASAIQPRMPVGQSQSLHVKFQPDQTGLLSVNLRFKTTAPGQPDTIIHLTGTSSGTGPTLTVARAANQIQLSWTGAETLESADQVVGPWTAVAGATSPQNIAITGVAKFYRLRVQ
jgi:Zn-dependent metalloprotease